MAFCRFGVAQLVAGAVLSVSPLLLTSCSQSDTQATRFLERGKRRLENHDYARAVLDLKNAVRLKPKSAEARYQLGMAQIAIRDMAGAVASFRKAVEIQPAHVNARVMLAQILATSSNEDVLRQAEDIARRGLAVSGENANLMNALAYIEVRLGRPDDADRRLQETLSRFPRHLGAVVAAARLRLSRNDVQGAEEVLRKAADLEPPVTAAVVALGDLYAKTGRHAEAESQFKRALQLEPESAPALIGLAELRIRAGENNEAESLLKRVSSQRNSPYRFLYANLLLASGKHALAITELQETVRRDPADRDARTQLVGAYASSGKTTDAARVLAQALDRNPKDAEALLQRAVLSLMAKDYELAQRDVDRLMRFRSDSPLAHYLQARIHLTRGAAPRGRQSLMEALRLRPDFLPARLALADALLAARDAKAALDVVDAAPDGQKQDLSLTARRNWALILSRDTVAARAGVDAARARSRMPDFLVQDAMLKLKEGNHAGARAALEETLARSPGDVRAAELLAHSYALQKDLSTAVQRVRYYASRAPGSAEMQYLLGKTLAAAGNSADARRAFEAAKSLDPRSALSDVALAELDIRDGALDSAKRRLAALSASHPESATVHLSLANIEERTGNAAGAIEHYRRAVDLDTSNVIAANNLAYLLIEFARQPDEALKYAQQAKRLAPDNTAVDDTIGWALYHKGLFATAITHLEPAAAHSKSAVRKFHLAMAYFKAGEKARAQAALESGLRIDARVPEAVIARRLITETGAAAK